MCHGLDQLLWKSVVIRYFPFLKNVQIFKHFAHKFFNHIYLQTCISHVQRSSLPNPLTTLLIFSISSGQMSEIQYKEHWHISNWIYNDLGQTWTMRKSKINHTPFAFETIRWYFIALCINQLPFTTDAGFFQCLLTLFHYR